jgi:hypothetical protein
VGSERKVIDFEPPQIEQDWARLSVSWFASELCFSVAMLCCSARFVTRMKIEQRINLKFLVKPKKKTLIESIQLLKEVYDDNTMSCTRIFNGTNGS